MAYSTISHWNATEWTDEMEALARHKFIPMIMGVGAQSVQMVRTGELSFSVVTNYADEKACADAQARIAEIRAEAKTDLPMTMQSVVQGAVFASG